MKTKGITQKFRRKYKDYLEGAYYEKEDRNLGDEMVSDIREALTSQREEFRKTIMKDMKNMEHAMFCKKKGKQFRKCCKCVLEAILKELE